MRATLPPRPGVVVDAEPHFVEYPRPEPAGVPDWVVFCASIVGALVLVFGSGWLVLGGESLTSVYVTAAHRSNHARRRRPIFVRTPPDFIVDRSVDPPWLPEQSRFAWIGPSIVAAVFFAVLAVAVYFGGGL